MVKIISFKVLKEIFNNKMFKFLRNNKIIPENNCLHCNNKKYKINEHGKTIYKCLICYNQKKKDKIIKKNYDDFINKNSVSI